MEIVLGLIAVAVIGYIIYSSNRPSVKTENDKINEQAPTAADPVVIADAGAKPVAVVAPTKKPQRAKPAAKAPQTKKPAAKQPAKPAGKKPAGKGKPAAIKAKK